MDKSKVGMTRRGFLWNSGLGAITAVTAKAFSTGSGVVLGQGAKGKYGPFKMGFQSYSLRHFKGIDDCIGQAQKLELAYVELYRGHLDPSSPQEKVKEVRERLAAAGLQVNAFGVERYTADHAQNEALFEFGKALGVTNLSADPEKDAFPSLEKLVRQYDIRIAIHNHGPEDKRWARPEWILDSVKSLDPRIGSCADLGHFIRSGINPVEAIERLGSRVLGVHFKDFDKSGKDVVLGQGQLNVVKTLAALKKVGFNGPLSLEFEGDVENPVPKMLESLTIVRQALKTI